MKCLVLFRVRPFDYKAFQCTFPALSENFWLKPLLARWVCTCAGWIRVCPFCPSSDGCSVTYWPLRIKHLIPKDLRSGKAVEEADEVAVVEVVQNFVFDDLDDLAGLATFGVLVFSVAAGFLKPLLVKGTLALVFLT